MNGFEYFFLLLSRIFIIPQLYFRRCFVCLPLFLRVMECVGRKATLILRIFRSFFPPPPLSCGFNGKCLRSMSIFEMVVNINGSSFIHQVTPFFARPPTLSAHPHVFTTKRIYRYQSDRGRCKMALARVAIRDVSRFLKPSKWELKRRESFTFSVRLFFII